MPCPFLASLCGSSARSCYLCKSGYYLTPDSNLLKKLKNGPLTG